jgi:hypothetical protein
MSIATYCNQSCNVDRQIAVNSMSFIWNDNMREKREATPLHANASVLTRTDS